MYKRQGLLVGGVNFTDLKWVMKAAEIGADGKEIAPAVSLDYGQFLQATFDVLIIAFSIFLFIRLITKLTTKKNEEAPAAPPAPPAPVSYTHLDVYKRQALKLAQFDFLKRTGRTVPLLLLDDIFDKLDASRCLLYTSRCV